MLAYLHEYKCIHRYTQTHRFAQTEEQTDRQIDRLSDRHIIDRQTTSYYRFMYR